MIFRTQEMLFFSLNEYTAKAFERYVRYTGKEYKKFSNFRLIRDKKEAGTGKNFSHLQELEYYLDKLKPERLANLILVIDQYSLPQNDDDVKTLVKELFVQYPEVKSVFVSFNFDWINLFPPKEHKCDISKTLKCKIDRCTKDNGEHKNKEPQKPVNDISLPYIHNFNLFSGLSGQNNQEKDDPFDLLVRGQSNLFDASNLRNTIKQDFYHKIKVRSNYPKVQCSRLHHFALVVEEEIPQAYFNAYAMYAHGFRVLPVISCKELDYLGNNTKELTKSSLKIIARDYDLQFEDYENDKKLYELRGIKWIEEKKIWMNIDNLWNKLLCVSNDITTIFISRYDVSNNTNEPQIKKDEFKSKKDKKNKKNGIKLVKNSKAFLYGLAKPLNGVYELLDIEEIMNVYLVKKYEPPINIKRETGGHSTSPFIFHIADNLIKRSKRYLDAEMYLLSAMLAKEAVEILNGFHFMMVLKAMYLYYIAETHLIVNTMGAEEDVLALNTSKRLIDIKQQIERVCKENPKAKKNVLNQIFNDIRHICHEKELFKVADVALNELVNVRHGCSIKKFQGFLKI